MVYVFQSSPEAVSSSPLSNNEINLEIRCIPNLSPSLDCLLLKLAQKMFRGGYRKLANLIACIYSSCYTLQVPPVQSQKKSSIHNMEEVFFLERVVLILFLHPSMQVLLPRKWQMEVFYKNECLQEERLWTPPHPTITTAAIVSTLLITMN